MTETAVSIVLPVHNAGKWLDECLHSLCSQTTTVKLELSVYNDGSTDDSEQVIERWKERLREKDISLVLSGHCSDSPKGVGCAKNQAVRQSSGSFLCFLDADDVMMPERIACQLSAAQCHPNSIVGSQFHREPEGSTLRFTAWANSLSQSQLLYQVYTSHGPTVIMPTWFCSREVFDKVGGFDEGGKGVPEDLIFFYQHLEMGGGVVRVDQDLLMYRYHPQATTFSISEVTIWKLRVEFLEKQVLSLWPKFTIWNAGKQGRRLYRALQPSSQKKVTAMCDVDGKKIAKGFYTYEESKERPKPRIPVVDFHHASPPFVICVKLDLTGGNFEKNLASLNLEEGKHYVHFN